MTPFFSSSFHVGWLFFSLLSDVFATTQYQYLIHEFPAFLHHFLIDHCGLVRLQRLLVGLKGVLHQADETGAPPRISGH